ncbi:TPA: hypothetical protein HA361_05605 [Candidatus Woesearchaeota archaeon]|nr:hypothetical protein [Candidatus Woesearchaeota archaeon]HII69074.1 hypothetical protein [Candidatus Woesearchaeota archaeon]
MVKAFEAYVPTPTAYIRYAGVWDMQDLYESLVDWFRQKKYHFHEKIYKHKHPSPFGIERQYVWAAERKENEYVKIAYNFYMHTYDCHDVQVVMKDGTAREFTKGRIWIEVKVNIQFDDEKRWDEKAFYRHLKDFYNKYVNRKRLMQGYSPKFRTEQHSVCALIAERLKLQTEGFEHAHLGGVYNRT